MSDFIPVRPYLFMNQADIDIMRDNVLVKEYPWAVALYQQARNLNKPVWFSTQTCWSGRYMLGCALVYHIDGDDSYANFAVDWLKTFADNDWDPNTDGDFTQIHGVISATYDLMHNFMESERPTHLTMITNWLEQYAVRCNGNFGHNQNHQVQYGKAMAGYALGRSVYIDEIATKFQAWYQGTGQVFDGFHYEGNGQAMKHWNIVFEGQVYYALATHRAAERGYHSFDALTWHNSEGRNLVRDNWRMVLKKSTPRFQVPYESMWRGMLFNWPNCTGTHQSIYAATEDPEWAAPVRQHPARDVDVPQCQISQWTIMNYWAGLAHGREHFAPPMVKNDSFDSGHMGFAVILSGDPNGFSTEDSLHAYLMRGEYGSVPPLNLLLYGKGERLNTALMDQPDDVWGERGIGGSYVIPAPWEITTDPAPIKFKNFTDPEFKIISVDSVDQRVVAVTDRYFVDVYTSRADGLISFYYDGIGGTDTFATIGGTNYTNVTNLPTSANFRVTWPDHGKLFMINDQASTVTLIRKTNLPNLTRKIYPSDAVMCLRVRRSDPTTPNRFISVIEPTSEGCSPSISIISRFESSQKTQVTSLKVEAQDFTDFIVIAHIPGSYTLTKDGDTILFNGNYGWIHYDRITGTFTKKGDIISYTLDCTPATVVSAPVITATTLRLFENETTVSLSCATPGAVCRYTLNGEEPDENSTEYGTPFVLIATTTVKARAFKSGKTNSNITTAIYTKHRYLVKTPTIAPQNITFSGSVLVTITPNPGDSSIYYTLDGSEPTWDSTKYNAPVTISSTKTLKARAYKTGWTQSGVRTATYTET